MPGAKGIRVVDEQHAEVDRRVDSYDFQCERQANNRARDERNGQERSAHDLLYATIAILERQKMARSALYEPRLNVFHPFSN